jgi:hypothetical protein
MGMGISNLTQHQFGCNTNNTAAGGANAGGYEPIRMGYIYALCLFLSAMTQSLCINQYFFRGFRLGLRIRASTNQLVYHKVCARSSYHHHCCCLHAVNTVRAVRAVTAVSVQ